MTTTRIDNVRALEHRFGHDLPAAPEGPVRQRPSVSGGHAAVEIDSGGGRWMRLVSVRDPLADAAAWLDASGVTGETETVILVGSGLGYALDVLEHRGVPTRVVVVEPHAALAGLLLERRNWRHLIEGGRLAVLAGPAYEGISSVARLTPGVQNAPVHVHPVLGRAWPAQVRDALAAVERLRFEAAANEEAKRALAGRYLRHTLANAARLTREGDAAALEGIFAGTPAVIAAAGPSLDSNLNDLHLVGDRALLVACDTALRPLLSLGLEPQLTVAIDPSVANACHLGALHEPRRTWLAAEASLHPPAFAHFDRRTFFFRIGDHEPWPWLRGLGLERMLVRAWGSVVTAALDLVLRMGCDPVIIAGADLAFTGGHPYCRGTTLEAQWASWVAGGESYDRAFALLMDRWPAVMEPDITGSPVRTASHLVAFRDWMRTRAGLAAPVRIINATGAGILHGGTIHQASATTTLAAYPPLDLEAIQARLAAAHRPARDPGALFTQIAALADREWRWPAEWIAADPNASTDLLRGALAGPEYAAWQIGRGSRSAAAASGPAAPLSPTRLDVS
jgi:hypothetical protein